jgi:hypothetical protein
MANLVRHRQMKGRPLETSSLRRAELVLHWEKLRASAGREFLGQLVEFRSGRLSI